MHACRRDTLSLGPSDFHPPRVTDLADVGLHIFNQLFSSFFFPFFLFPFFPDFSRLQSQLSLSLPLSLSLSLSLLPFRYSCFVWTCLSTLFIAFFLSFLSLLSPSYPGTRARFVLKSGYFRSGKKSEKSADSLHEPRGSPRMYMYTCVSESVTNGRTSTGVKRTAEEKGVVREGGGRIESKTAKGK